MASFWTITLTNNFNVINNYEGDDGHHEGEDSPGWLSPLDELPIYCVNHFSCFISQVLESLKWTHMMDQETHVIILPHLKP